MLKKKKLSVLNRVASCCGKRLQTVAKKVPDEDAFYLSFPKIPHLSSPSCSAYQKSASGYGHRNNPEFTEPVRFCGKKAKQNSEETSSTGDETSEICKFASKKVIKQHRLEKAFAKAQETPLKTFKQITMSFIERPKKSTQTDSDFNLKLSDKSKHRRHHEPNLRKGQVKVPFGGAPELVGDARWPIDKSVSSKSRLKTVTEAVDSEVRDIVDEVARTATCLAQCAIVDGLDASCRNKAENELSALEASAAADDNRKSLPSNENLKDQKELSVSCKQTPDIAFAMRNAVITSPTQPTDRQSREALSSLPAGSQSELVSTMPCESESDFSSLFETTSCSSLDWDNSDGNRLVLYDNFIVPAE